MKYREFYRSKLTSYAMEFVREKQLIRFRVPFPEIENGTFDDILKSDDWNQNTNYYEVTGGLRAINRYGKLFSKHFADSPDYQRLLAAFDFGEVVPCRRIQLSGDAQRFYVYSEYDEDLIATVKKYGATWDKYLRIWTVPVGLNAASLAKKLSDEGFKLSDEISQWIATYESNRPFSYEVLDEQITLRNLTLPDAHAFLARSKRASFDQDTETWTIRPNYEIAKFLKEALQEQLDKKTNDWFQEFIDSADLLDQLSLNGKITHEDHDPLPEGLALIRGKGLYTICKQAKINYCTAVSYGPRPFARSIGIFILQSDREKFETQSKRMHKTRQGETLDAIERFKANPKRTKLKIYVDATPYNWAFKVFNGSKHILLTRSGPVTGQPATVNTGEYQALIEGLKWLEKHPAKEALILSDSQTIIRQVCGSPVKTTHLEPLRDEAQERLKACATHTPTSIRWHPGRRNKADAASRRKDYWHQLDKEKTT